MASVLRQFVLRPIANLFDGAGVFLLNLGGRKLKEELLGRTTDRLLEILLKVMSLSFYLLKKDVNYQNHLRDSEGRPFGGRYLFQTTREDGIIASAIFENGDMKVWQEAIDDWDVRITFTDGTAIRNFMFSEDKDILDRVQYNDVEVDGNLNYMYKFRFMCRDLSRRLDLAMGPTVYDRQTVRQSLAAEEREARHPIIKLILGLTASLAVGILVFALPVGLLVVWSDKLFGLRLFLAAGIAGIVLLTARQFLRTYLPQLGGSRKAEKTAKPETDALEERTDRYEVFETLPIIGVVLGTLPGFVWLAYSVFVAHKISLPSLALIAIPCLTWTGMKVIDLCREFWYFSRLLRLSDRFETDLKTKKELDVLLDRGIPISPREADLLSQVEMRQMAHRTARTKETFSQLEWHSIFVAKEALKFLELLPKEQYAKRYAVRAAIREVIDSLQLNPRPAEARAIPENENVFVIVSGDYEITYVVDRGKQRINVTDIRDTRQGEVSHAS